MTNETNQSDKLTPAPSEIVPEVERQIADQLPEQFRRLPESVKKETVRKVSVAAMKVSVSSWDCDAYPPPAILEEYERFSPGFADKIIVMVEKELDHRMDMEAKVSSYFTRGQWMGFILSFIAIAGAIWLISIGKEVTGGILGGAVIIPLVTVFVRGQLKVGSTEAANHGEVRKTSAPPRSTKKKIPKKS